MVFQFKKIYFVGIGGIGMSALAKFSIFNQMKVYGYDKNQTHLTHQLEEMGAIIYYQDHLLSIVPDIDLVVYTPAIDFNNKILYYYHKNNYTIFKRSDFLQSITENKKVLAIAGTHGKTTISTLTAHLLQSSDKGCNAFLGGIALNYNTNYWSSNSPYFVVEADEYDKSFLKLKPYIALVNSIDKDHLDIYHNVENIYQAFNEFVANCNPNGNVIINSIYKKYIHSTAKVLTYSITKNYTETLFISNATQVKETWKFIVNYKDIPPFECFLKLPGKHNLENAAAAILIALLLQIEPKKIQKSLLTFKGIKRRFEFKLLSNNKIIIDDYAHHPNELLALIEAVKNTYPNKTFTLIFQPHLFSRTKDMFIEFAQALDQAPEIILLPIYPAREILIPNVSSDLILNTMKSANKQILSNQDCLNWALNTQEEILVFAGAGDIDQLVDIIVQKIKK